MVSADLTAAECPAVNPADGATWDYTDPANWKPAGSSRVKLVEDYHFNAEVEALLRGMSAADAGGDIAYTLRRFPNHHRALWAMSRWLRMLNEKKDLRLQQYASADCYFQRAISFQPNDAKVFMLYAGHLQTVNRGEDALGLYRRAERMGLDTADLHYNMGMLLVDLGQAEEAVEHARKAYAKGFKLVKLRKRLEKLGYALD